MHTQSRAVLTGAVVFATAMGALECGGWWWAWLAGIALLVFRGRVRLPLLGVNLDPAARFMVRENRKTRHHTRYVVRRERRKIRDRRRAMRQCRRQTR